jgi:pre-mRNA 3'-end-processing factor FIP1
MDDGLAFGGPAVPQQGPTGPQEKITVDLDAVAKLDGKDLYEVDLDAFEDKPWRKPGADITDYFNYGFNELTWKLYCQKQRAMREEIRMNVNAFWGVTL